MLSLSAGAEEIGKIIPEKVDKVLCNSAFWQFPDKDAVLQAIYYLLKSNGIFCFNMPDQFYTINKERRIDINYLISQEMIKRGWVPPKEKPIRYNFEDIQKMIKKSKMKIIKRKIIEFKVSKKSGLDFLKIPAMRLRLKSFSEKEQEEIIKEVEKKANALPDINKIYWEYFVVGK